MSRKIMVKEIIERFELNLLNDGNVNRFITFPGFARVGIELASQFTIHKKLRTAVLWSSNEGSYLKTMSKEQLEKAMEFVCKLEPPVIFLTKGFNATSLIMPYITKYNITLAKTELNSYEVFIEIGSYISKKLAHVKTIHGTLIVVYGVGVLLIGESGIGKSEIALELLKKGHLFVADDAVDVSLFGKTLMGEANKFSDSFIEVRGLGILNVGKMFGLERVAKESSIDVIIELKAIDSHIDKFERIGDKVCNTLLNGTKVSKYVLPITPGRKVSDLVETAIVDFKLKEKGYNSGKEFIKHCRKLNVGGKGE